MSAPRTATLILSGALGVGSLVGLAAPALAETPPAQGTEVVLALGDGGGGFDGPGEIAQPEPAPQPPQDKAPVPPPDPEPQPKPLPGPGEIAHPAGDPGPDPLPDEELPIAHPEHDGPGLPDGPDDLKDKDPVEPCNPLQATCDIAIPEDEDDDCHPLQATCELTEPGPSEDEPGGTDGGEGSEVQSGGEDRGPLPRTGAGLAGLAVAGSALTGLGAALRRVARR